MDSSNMRKGGAVRIIVIALLLVVVLAATTVFMYLQALGSAYKPKDESYVQAFPMQEACLIYD